MDLLNQTLNNFSAQVSDLAFIFNPDIFEANVINLIILLGGIFYFGGNALKTSLFERQQKILRAIQEAEERLQQSVSRLKESEKKLAQAQLLINSIKKDAEITSKQVKGSLLTEGKAEIERLTLVAKLQIANAEAKVRKEISDYVVALALKRVTLQLEGKLNTNLQQQILDRNISKLSD